MNDPRTRYRVELDAALSRGDETAWARYQNAAALAVAPQEDFEWERARLVRGDPVNARSFISYRALMTVSSANEGRAMVEREYRRLDAALIEAGADPLSLRREPPWHSFARSGYDIAVTGVIA